MRTSMAIEVRWNVRIKAKTNFATLYMGMNINCFNRLSLKHILRLTITTIQYIVSNSSIKNGYESFSIMRTDKCAEYRQLNWWIPCKERPRSMSMSPTAEALANKEAQLGGSKYNPGLCEKRKQKTQICKLLFSCCHTTTIMKSAANFLFLCDKSMTELWQIVRGQTS